MLEQIRPEKNVSFLESALKSISTDTIWELTLFVQDQMMIFYEMNFLKKSRAFRQSTEILDVSWGLGKPIVRREFVYNENLDQKTQKRHIQEVALSFHYLFQGNAKASQFLKDIESKCNSLGTDFSKKSRFDMVRLYLIAQHVRQHGILLKGLIPYLKSSAGYVLIIDAKDELINFSPQLPNIQRMYVDLKAHQKSSGGGERSASDIIRKRASTFGFSVVDSQIIACETRNVENQISMFQMICFHMELISRAFPIRINQKAILEEAKAWALNPESWEVLGFIF